MKCLDLEMNNSQLAVAVDVVYLSTIKHKRKQFWTYPAGAGKAHIMVAIMIGILNKAILDKVIVVFHDDLMVE